MEVTQLLHILNQFVTIGLYVFRACGEYGSKTTKKQTNQKEINHDINS